MKEIIFIALLKMGFIIPMGEKNDDRSLYTVNIKGKTYEHAYKEEIINWIKTGDFYYDEDLSFDRWTAIEENDK
jgi:hypothetical protein